MPGMPGGLARAPMGKPCGSQALAGTVGAATAATPAPWGGGSGGILGGTRTGSPPITEDPALPCVSGGGIGGGSIRGAVGKTTDRDRLRSRAGEASVSDSEVVQAIETS